MATEWAPAPLTGGGGVLRRAGSRGGPERLATSRAAQSPAPGTIHARLRGVALRWNAPSSARLGQKVPRELPASATTGVRGRGGATWQALHAALLRWAWALVPGRCAHQVGLGLCQPCQGIHGHRPTTRRAGCTRRRFCAYRKVPTQTPVPPPLQLFDLPELWPRWGQLPRAAPPLRCASGDMHLRRSAGWMTREHHSG